MKSIKPNRKSTKTKREYKPKTKKDLKQRVRHYKQFEDMDRNGEILIWKSI
jgi:hypothetical protein